MSRVLRLVDSSSIVAPGQVRHITVRRRRPEKTLAQDLAEARVAVQTEPTSLRLRIEGLEADVLALRRQLDLKLADIALCKARLNELPLMAKEVAELEALQTELAELMARRKRK